MPSGANVDQGNVLTLSGLTAGALNNYLVAPMDVSKYRWLSVSIGNGAYSGLLVPRWSDDGTQWNILKMYPMTSLDAGDVVSAGTSGNNLVLGSFVSFQYFQMQMESYSSGAASGRLDLYSDGLPGFQLTKTYMRAIASDLALNSQDILLASGVVNADGHTGVYPNSAGRGIKLYISPGTFGSGASGIVVTLQGFDPASGTYYDILASAALADSTFQVIELYPGIPDVANITKNGVLPCSWRVKWHATNWGTGGSTLGISYSAQF